jgi:hypothetical protein
MEGREQGWGGGVDLGKIEGEGREKGERVNMDQNVISPHRASLRVSDAYLHVPGFHPSIDNPIFFQQRVDDPSIVPSIHKHLWGRVASLGHLTLQVEKKLHIRQSDSSVSLVDGKTSRSWEVQMGDQPLMLSGEARSLMLEWSQPTVMMVAKVLDHCQREYAEVFRRHLSSSSSSSFSSSSGASPSSSSYMSASSSVSKGNILPSSAFVGKDSLSPTTEVSSSKHRAKRDPLPNPGAQDNLKEDPLLRSVSRGREDPLPTSVGGGGKDPSPPSVSPPNFASSERDGLSPSSSSSSSVFFPAMDTWPTICLQFLVTDVNVFIYGLTPGMYM